MSENEQESSVESPVSKQPQALPVEAPPPPAEAKASVVVPPPTASESPLAEALRSALAADAPAAPSAESAPAVEAKPATSERPERPPREARPPREPRGEKKPGDRPPRPEGKREGPESHGRPNPNRENPNKDGRREGGGPPREGGRRDDRGPRGPFRPEMTEIELEKLVADPLYLDNQAHAVVARMRDMDSGTKSQLRRFYNAVRRACATPEADRQHQFVMLRARLAYTIARHSLRSLDSLERLLLQVTRKNESRGYERFRDLFEAIIAYNE